MCKNVKLFGTKSREKKGFKGCLYEKKHPGKAGFRDLTFSKNCIKNSVYVYMRKIHPGKTGSHYACTRIPH